MAEAELRSALIVAFPQASPIVDEWREQTCGAKPSAGVPPHVTILWPFVPAASIDDALTDRLRRLFGSLEPFMVEFPATARFPDTLYLTPDPAEPFVELTRAVWEAYPEYPPYEGVFDAIEPHLTAAQGTDDVLAEAEADVRRRLPIVARVDEVVLIEEIEPDSALWRPRATFPLRAAA
jgi:2'-5' RNA ligase